MRNGIFSCLYNWISNSTSNCLYNELNNEFKLQSDLINHHNLINKIDDIYTCFLENKKVSWLLNNPIFYNGKNQDLSI